MKDEQPVGSLYGRNLTEQEGPSPIECCRRQFENIIYVLDRCPDMLDSIRAYAQTGKSLCERVLTGEAKPEAPAPQPACDGVNHIVGDGCADCREFKARLHRCPSCETPDKAWVRNSMTGEVCGDSWHKLERESQPSAEQRACSQCFIPAEDGSELCRFHLARREATRPSLVKELFGALEELVETVCDSDIAHPLIDKVLERSRVVIRKGQEQGL